MSSRVLAQCNISRLLAPLDSPQLAPFVAELLRINALAGAAPGFLWRLKTPTGDATSLRIFDDEMIIVNMSIWESIDALFAFTYRTGHTDIVRKRDDWFERAAVPMVALWWTPRDIIPTVEDMKERLEHLRKHGATPFAFTFRQRFPAPLAELQR